MSERNGKFLEAEYEKAVIALFEQQGYDYVYGEGIVREYKDILLKDDLRRFLFERYAKDNITENEVETAVDRLDYINSSSLYNMSKETYLLFSEGFDLKREDCPTESIHIDYVDFENTDNNFFKVVNQYTVEYDGNKHRIPDLLVFVNGIPVSIFEFKTIIREEKTIKDAWEQICIRYTQDIPRLLKYCFLAVISDGANTRFGTVFTDYKHFYAWNKVNDEDFEEAYGIRELETLIQGAFDKDRILAVLRDFVYYPDTSSDELAIVCRYPQFFATGKMLESIKEHLKPEGDGKGGTYYGATGCGKTYTMLFLARLMSRRDCDVFHNPTILIVEDREDLDDQTTKLFTNATQFLNAGEVRSIESREDLGKNIRNIQSGGVYITTIQKFCDGIGLLSDRPNIIVLSDEAHRSQLNTGSELAVAETEIKRKFGYAECLRKSFPNATYCGFTGTPIDETYAVFGKEVDRYTMDEAVADGITTEIAYQSRLARVRLSEEKAKEMQAYYDKCLAEGSTPEQVEESKKTMSKMREIIADPERLKSIAEDIVSHYEVLCAESPNVVKKAMIVCYDRPIALEIYKNIQSLRPEWTVAKKCEDESKIPEEELNKLEPLPMLNFVATEGLNDSAELRSLCRHKEYRKMLNEQFKNENSNFRIAVVVDMWTTGFDVDSLAVMYIDKPLYMQNLIQTISRVNRKYDGKKYGYIIDYIGIETALKMAKKNAGIEKDPIKEIQATIVIFRSMLETLDKILADFDADKFYRGEPFERLLCLRNAVEFVLFTKDREDEFMRTSRVLRAAYDIANASGELTEEETERAEFYIAIRSIIYKQTKPGVPDTEIMNRHIEKMIREALSVDDTIEILDEKKEQYVTSEEFNIAIQSVKLPNSRFNILLTLLRRSVNELKKKNRVKAIEFDKRIMAVVERYNSRKLSVGETVEVVQEVVYKLSDELVKIHEDLKREENEFEKLGISWEEKAFYDILIDVRDKHEFAYSEERAKELAKAVKKLIDEKSKFAGWSTREDIINDIDSELYNLLGSYDYPQEWEDDVYEKVMEQAKLIVNL